MADRSWITVFFPTPLIFRYHLPLRVGAEKREMPSLQIQHILFWKLRYLTKTQLDFSVIYSLVHSSQNTRGGSYCNRDNVVWRRVSLKQWCQDESENDRVPFKPDLDGKLSRLGIGFAIFEEISPEISSKYRQFTKYSRKYKDFTYNSYLVVCSRNHKNIASATHQPPTFVGFKKLMGGTL